MSSENDFENTGVIGPNFVKTNASMVEAWINANNVKSNPYGADEIIGAHIHKKVKKAEKVVVATPDLDGVSSKLKEQQANTNKSEPIPTMADEIVGIGIKKDEVKG